MEIALVSFLVTFVPLMGIFWYGIRNERMHLQSERVKLQKLTQWSARARRFKKL
jgi:hypothetical protein